MKRLKLLFGFLCCGVLVWTCVPAGTPGLFVNAIEDSTGARIEISATEGDGTVGKGVVTLTASSGMLDKTSLTLDAYGAASARLACDPAADTTCLTGRVVAQWTPKGANAPVVEEVRLHFGTIGMDGGTGGGGGTGGVVFDGGINALTVECLGHVPELYPTCCRTNPEFGKQQPKCPAVQMQPGATFPVAFNGYMAGSTAPFATGIVYNVTFQGPTSIMSAAECTLTSTASLTADYNGEVEGLSATVVYGRLNTRLWVGSYAGGGGAVPMPTICTENGGYPDRIAYYVTMEGLGFTGSDGKIWKEAGPETYFYTVALARF